MWDVWSVWRVTGRDPFLIYHDLDDHFVPWGGGEPMPPPYSSRHRALLFAFGKFEFKTQARLAGAKLPEDQPRRPARQEQ